MWRRANVLLQLSLVVSLLAGCFGLGYFHTTDPGYDTVAHESVTSQYSDAPLNWRDLTNILNECVVE